MMTSEQIRRLEERGAQVTVWRSLSGIVGYSVSWPVATTSSGARVYGAKSTGWRV